MLSVGLKIDLEWSGDCFWEPQSIFGYLEKAKMLSLGLKIDLEWSGDSFRGLQSIFGISLKGENALCGPQS